MTTSVLNGFTEGDFHSLRILNNGTMTDINTLLGGAGGGADFSNLTGSQGITITTSNNNANADIGGPDLSSYATTTALTPHSARNRMLYLM